MKRVLIAALAVFVIALSFASCYDPDAGIKDKSKIASTTSAENATTKATEAKAKKVSDSKYSDTYEGLRDYMKAWGYIKTDDQNNILKMQADKIGAEKGYKYTDGDTRVELYSFNFTKDNSTRDKVIESVKNNGTFVLYGETIPAYLSDNGKYLMVYSNAAANDKNSDAYKTKQNAVKAFKSFKANSGEKTDSEEKSDVQETTAKAEKK